MKDIQNFAEALVEEGLSEAAGTFFGKRKRLEDEILIFKSKCTELRNLGEEVILWGHALGFMFPDAEAVAEFYTAIGVDPCEATQLLGHCWNVDITLPHALFPKTRYSKAVYAIYCQLYKVWDLYQYGYYYNDLSRPGGKKQSVNLDSMREWLERLNATIDATNQDNQASQVLQFAKQFRLGETEKERIVGAGVNYTLDDDLAFPEIDAEACGFLSFPEIPEPQTVKKGIISLCGRIYSAHKDTITSIMKEVKSS